MTGTERTRLMARQKPLDVETVQAWLAVWNESNVFSDDAFRHLRSLITDPFCFVVVTLMVGGEPRSLVFRRVKRMLPSQNVCFQSLNGNKSFRPLISPLYDMPIEWPNGW